MKSKLTIALAVLLLAILAMPHTADAQDGYTVSRVKGLDKVIATGNNQAIPAVVLTSRAEDDEPPIERDDARDLTISVRFGDLPIVQATAWLATSPPTQITATSGDFTDTTNDPIQFKVGAKELLIFVPDGTPTETTGVAVNTMIKLADIRLDLTSLDAGDSVPVTVTSSDQADTIGLGGGGGGGVSATLTTAEDGLSVEAAKGNGLTCGTIDGATVTVKEGFAGAWNPALMGADTAEAGGGGPDDNHFTDMDKVGGAVQIRLDVINFPDNEGAKIEWPESVKDNRKDEDPDTLVGSADTAIATLTLDKEDSDGNGKFAIYTYADVDAVATSDQGTTEGTDAADDDTNTGVQRFLNDATRSFAIGGIGFKNFGGATIDVTARLWPVAKRNSDGKKNAADVKSVLSFEHAAEDPTYAKDAREGPWVIVEDCITYLLYPFVTCGATPGWTTGISVSNTSKDVGVFGAFDETEDQSGGVILYGFPRSSGGEVPEPVVAMLTDNLAAGDTHTFGCDQTVMAGMEGYAIIKANFQHARGMGFVMGNFADGAAVDVSHGYMAEVIDDPADRSEKIE